MKRACVALVLLCIIASGVCQVRQFESISLAQSRLEASRQDVGNTYFEKKFLPDSVWPDFWGSFDSSDDPEVEVMALSRRLGTWLARPIGISDESTVHPIRLDIVVSGKFSRKQFPNESMLLAFNSRSDKLATSSAISHVHIQSDKAPQVHVLGILRIVDASTGGNSRLVLARRSYLFVDDSWVETGAAHESLPM